MASQDRTRMNFKIHVEEDDAEEVTVLEHDEQDDRTEEAVQYELEIDARRLRSRLLNRLLREEVQPSTSQASETRNEEDIDGKEGEEDEQKKEGEEDEQKKEGKEDEQKKEGKND